MSPEPADSDCPHHHEEHNDGVMMPALNFRRPDELSDYHLMELLDRVAEQMQMQDISHDRITYARQLIYRAIDSIDQETWSQVYELKVWSPASTTPLTLWNILVNYGGYPIDEHRPDQDWEMLPSGGQVFYSLAMHIGAHRSPGTPF